MRRRLTLRIFGEVQGVGFRLRTLEVARALGLKGFVRNEPDGTVSIEACGEEERLGALIEWIRTRAPGTVRDVWEAWKEGGEEFEDFEIRS